MRKLIMKMSMSLDGFVASPEGGTDWVFKTGDEQSKAWSVEKIRDAGLIIMGRKSFENMAGYWSKSTDVFAEPMNGTPKVVFSKKGFKGIDPKKTPVVDSWANARVFDGDLADGIEKLKAEQGGPILAIGGAEFMRNLLATGLVNEYRLAVHPVLLGAGMPIFNGISHPGYLKLTDIQTFPGGAIAHTYGV